MGNCCGSDSKNAPTPGGGRSQQYQVQQQQGNRNGGGGGGNIGNRAGAPGPASESDMYAIFKQFDVNGDGYIVKEELKQVMSSMGQTPTEEEVDAMFKAADANMDGQISFQEFCGIARANPLQISLKAVFAELDGDGDGSLTLKELKSAFQKMGHDVDDDDILRIIREADKNADSEINFDEFVTMMCQHKGL